MERKFPYAGVYTLAVSVLPTSNRKPDTPKPLKKPHSNWHLCCTPMKIQPKNEFNVICRDLFYILMPLSLCGVLPLDFKGLFEGQIRHRSRWTFLGLVSSAVISVSVFNWVDLIIEMVFEYPIVTSGRFVGYYQFIQDEMTKANAEPSVTYTLKNTFIFVCTSISIAEIIQVVIERIDFHHLTAFCRNCQDFNVMLSRAFPLTDFGSIDSLRKNTGLHYIVKLYLIIFHSVSPIIWFPLMGGAFASQKFSMSDLFVSYDLCAVLTIGLHCIWIEVWLDMKCAAMLATIERGYDAILIGVQEAVTWNPTLTNETVQQWRILIVMTRDQTKLAMKHLQKSQMGLILQTVVFTTANAFLAVHMSMGASQLNYMAAVWGLFAFFLVTRFFYKIFKAEKVTKKELELVKYLQGLETDQLDCRMEIQLNLTRHLMEMRPNKVEIGSGAPFSYNILLKIFQHVVTYFIVLIQFANN